MFDGVAFAWGLVVHNRGFVAGLVGDGPEVVFSDDPHHALLLDDRSKCQLLVQWLCDRFPGEMVGVRPFVAIQGKGGVQ